MSNKTIGDGLFWFGFFLMIGLMCVNTKITIVGMPNIPLPVPEWDLKIDK